jgi:hypothetical protein
VSYETSTINGTTGDDGKFLYTTKDKTITFKIDNLIIAEDFNLSNINSDGIVLPVDIVNDKLSTKLDRNNTSDLTVIKFLRVLQSLDNDGNASNGIVMEPSSLSIHGKIRGDTITKLKKALKDTEKTLKSQRKSREHYKKTLNDMKITPEFMPFITVWKTKDKNITIEAKKSNYTIDWGDKNIDKNVKEDKKTHTYADDGNYTIKISGDLKNIATPNKGQLLMISQWGDIAWDGYLSFKDYTNIDVNATDTPDLRKVTSLDEMFYGATSLTDRDFRNWDVSTINEHDKFLKDTGGGNKEPKWK